MSEQEAQPKGEQEKALCPEMHYVSKDSAEKVRCNTPLMKACYEYCPECGWNDTCPFSCTPKQRLKEADNAVVKALEGLRKTLCKCKKISELAGEIRKNGGADNRWNEGVAEGLRIARSELDTAIGKALAGKKRGKKGKRCPT